MNHTDYTTDEGFPKTMASSTNPTPPQPDSPTQIDAAFDDWIRGRATENYNTKQIFEFGFKQASIFANIELKKQLQDLHQQNTSLRADLDKLNDPVAVWVNILRGTIKVPEWLKDCRGIEQENTSLREQVESAKKIAAELFDIVETFSPKHPVLEKLKAGKEYVHKSELEAALLANARLVEGVKQYLQGETHAENNQLVKAGFHYIEAKKIFTEALSTNPDTNQKLKGNE